MFDVSIEDMMDAGAHFGHQTRRWNPKMQPYLFGSRSGIHIIDLERTHNLFGRALAKLHEIVSQGKDVLFVATKQQAQLTMESEAQRAGMPYVTRRWLGGMLTNFETINRSVTRLIDLETRREKNDFAGYKKKELLEVDREITRLLTNLGGIKKMKKVPGALFIIDPVKERIAVHEANVLNIPIFAVTDSNCDPDPIDYVIPGNDDSLRSITYFASKVATACKEGLNKRSDLALSEEPSADGKLRRRVRQTRDDEKKGRAFVGKASASEGEESTGAYTASVETLTEAVSEVKE